MTKFDARLVEAESGYALEQRGLKILRKLTLVEWQTLGREIGQRISSSHWAIGDWMNYGEDTFGASIRTTHKQFGQSKYDRAADLTGLSIETIELCCRVAREYPMARRVYGASWSKHRQALVARAAVRARLLDASVAEYWTVGQWETELAKQPRENETPRVEAVRATKNQSGRTRAVDTVRTIAVWDTQKVQVVWKYPRGKTLTKIYSAPPVPD